MNAQMRPGHIGSIRRTITLVIAACIAVACSVAPVEPREPLDTSLTAAIVGSDSAPPVPADRPVIEVVDGGVIISGQMPGPDPCQAFAVESSQSAAETVARIRVTAGQAPCIAVIHRYAYRLQLGMPAGSRRVRVVHEYVGSGWPSVVAVDTTVVVR